MRLKIPRDHLLFPKSVLKFDCVKGICVGKCIDIHHVTVKDSQAHAHVGMNKYYGWICLRNIRQLSDSLLLKHEIAHLLTSKEKAHHGKAWRKVVIEIGGTLEPYFHAYSNIQYVGFHKNGHHYF